MKVQKAKIDDVDGVIKLIDRFAKEEVMLPRGEDYILQNLRDYYVIKDGYSVIGCAALHIYTNRFAEIKSLAVETEFQAKALGKKLVDACLQEAKDLGIPKVFALTYITDFFKKLGFVDADKKELPEKIWKECVKCAKYTDCDESCLVYLIS